MNNVIKTILAQYKTRTLNDQTNALKEIIQEIALLGLWRAKFFEKAAFYGGSSLRILHGLNRFSEDLDFSLLEKNMNFKIKPYEKAIIEELSSYDFDVEIDDKPKENKQRTIISAFIKANTMVHLLKIDSKLKTQRNALLKIKLEIDIDPPLGFQTEVKQHFRPIPFSIKTIELSDLFAGKLHACLCRSDRINIKGRDWYDFLWYISRNISVNTTHLQKRMEQTGHWKSSKQLDLKSLKIFLQKKISTLDVNHIKKDVIPFIQNITDLDAWDKELFLSAIDKINDKRP